MGENLFAGDGVVEDLRGDGDQGESLSQWFFHVELVKARDEGVGDEEDEYEIEDGCGFVMEAVVQAPVLDEDVEDVVFDSPAPVGQSSP